MFRITTCIVAVLILTAHLQSASAQTGTAPAAPAATTTSPAAAGEAKPTRMKLTIQKIKEMKAKWSANKPKMKACRKEAKTKGLMGDDRWFFMSDCMDKS
jgi:psiF repeat